MSPLKAFIPRAIKTRAPQAPINAVDDSSVENVSDNETDKPIAINVLKILPRPSIITPGRNGADIKADPVCPLSSYNYKIDACQGTTHTNTSQKLTVLDTGPGPNVVKLPYLTM